jgi:FtsP/CotA-like multicopper oxidase with cupredoxin domain
MHTNTLVLHQTLSNKRRWLIALVVALTAVLGAVLAAHAAAIPSAACTGTPTARNFDLWAKPGTLALADGTTVNIWGYAANSANPAQLPGPTLVACAGDTVHITLHNQLGEASSLAVHGQSLRADTTGVADGADNSGAPYTFIAHSGSFVYQAGLTANGPKQAALGLYGALVVYPPTSGQAYTPTVTNADTAYVTDTLVLLSEIDPALNGVVPAPISTTFDMHDYAPKYWLINGKVYPQTDPIQAPAGSRVLLRFANAGFEEHSMGMLGLTQTVIAANGYLLPYSHGMVAETVPPASTMDTLMTMPASGQYPLYDANQHIDNNGASDTVSGFGGMFTFVSPTAAPPPANQAPVVNAGTDQTITLPMSATLAGTATDDGLPNPPATLTTTWTASGPGTVTFGDPAALNTTASFSVDGVYVLTLTADDGALTASSQITITVNPAPPVAADDAYSMLVADGTLTVTAPGVMANDSNLGVSPQVSLVTGPVNGTVTLNPDGSFTYTYTGTVAGTDTFTYQITSGASTSNIATVTITISLAAPPAPAKTNPPTGDVTAPPNGSKDAGTGAK